MRDADDFLAFITTTTILLMAILVINAVALLCM
jgi:hypothetical protein